MQTSTRSQVSARLAVLTETFIGAGYELASVGPTSNGDWRLRVKAPADQGHLCCLVVDEANGKMTFVRWSVRKIKVGNVLDIDARDIVTMYNELDTTGTL